MTRQELYQILLTERHPSEGIDKFLKREYPKFYKRYLRLYGQKFVAQHVYTDLHPDTRTTCLGCNGRVGFADFRKGFARYCSTKCKNTSDAFKKSVKQSNLDKYGVSHWMELESIKKRIRKTNLKKYGVENPMQNAEIQQKARETSLQKYGTENPAASQFVKDKIKIIFDERYNGAPLRNPDVLAKFIATNQKRYGGNAPFCSEDIKEKVKVTSLIKYGVSHPTKHISVQETRRRNAEAKYGIGKTHHMHDRDTFRRIAAAASKIKTIKIQGKTFHLQGYEPQTMKALDSKFKFYAQSRIPQILYRLNGKCRAYYPDLFASYKDKDILIEVKSSWYLGIGRPPEVFKEFKTKMKASSKTYTTTLALFLKSRRSFVLVPHPHRYTLEDFTNLYDKASKRSKMGKRTVSFADKKFHIVSVVS